MNLLARIRSVMSAKASAVGPLTARLVLNRPAWAKRDQAKLADEGYVQNVVAYRCIELIARNAASVPWVMYQGRGAKRREIETHALLDAMEQPNPLQDRAQFLTALISYNLIAGNAYCERTEEKRLDVMELYALRPDRMLVVPGEDGLPVGYEYRVGGAMRRFDVDLDGGEQPILHWKRFHPLDDWYGMSPMDPGGWSIDLHSEASAWNAAILRNSGAPSGAFVYGGDPARGNTMSDEQFERLKREMEQITGPDRAGNKLVLDGGLKWEQMGFDPQRMQAVEAKYAAAREIALAFGVPPMILGIPGDNTYSNYQEANRAFYRQTVIPLVKELCSCFAMWFRPAIGKGVYIEPDLDQVEALAIERQEMWTKLERVPFLTINEKREAVGYSPVQGGDELYIGAGQIPLSFDAALAGGAEPEPDPDKKPDEEDEDAPEGDGKKPPRDNVVALGGKR